MVVYAVAVIAVIVPAVLAVVTVVAIVIFVIVIGKRLYFLEQLRRVKVPPQDLALFYVSCIRSVVDYGISAFFHSLPQYLKGELVRLEKKP